MIKSTDPRSWGACWTDEQISTYFGTLIEIPVITIIGDDTITVEDRVWITCAYLARHNLDKLVIFARGCVDRVNVYAATYAADADAARATARAAVYAARATCAADAAADTAAYVVERNRQINHLLELCR